MVIKEKIHITPFNLNRTLHIYIPDNISNGERLPVLYMYDGHNLFYDRDATYGKCWGMKKYLDRNKARLIVVGLECNHKGIERLNEFSPYSFTDPDFGRVRGKGAELTRWMVDELKPYIDKKYPTKPQRQYTYIGGSSMGGLMSLFVIATESATFSKAVCISPYHLLVFKKLFKDMQHNISANTQVYISWGGEETDDRYSLAVWSSNNLLLGNELTRRGARVFPYLYVFGNHSEASWEKEIPIWMNELEIVKKEEKKQNKTTKVKASKKHKTK